MTLPHALFKFLSHNRFSFSYRSRHLSNSAEPERSSIETVISVHEDGLDSLDRPRNTSVDGLNQGLEPPEEPKIDRVDCTSSGSDHLSDEQATLTITSLEAGDLSIGSPHLKQGHVARQIVMISTSVIYKTTIIFPDSDTPASTSTSDSPLPTIVTLPLPTLTSSSTTTSPTLTSPITSSHSTTSSVNSSIQCDELGTGCSMVTTLQMSPTPNSYTAYATPTTPSDSTVAPTSNTSATIATTMSLQPVLASGTSSSSSSSMVSSSLAQSTFAPGTNSDPQSHPHMASIVGGVIGVVALLALLFFIAIWYRRKKRLSISPFTLPSTAITAQIGSEVRPQSQSIGNAFRPSGRGLPSVQYSDACLVEHSGNRCLSFITSSASSHLPDDDDDDFASIIVLHRQSNGLEKLYPSPSRARTSDHYCYSSVENWIDQVVLEDCSRQSSEVLPAYRSTKSLKSGEA
ncbi:hypothetical protein BDR07DRAFT_1384105 [Suillus spraguei]|nr:hypothetical protein BDR07DRAFT_1384105 [Suillus spraguei]